MPERRLHCGNGCLRCWVNNLRHGCPQSQKYLKEHPEIVWFDIIGDKKLQYKSKKNARWFIKKENEETQNRKRKLEQIITKIDTIQQIIDTESHISSRVYNKLDKLLKQRNYIELSNA